MDTCLWRRRSAVLRWAVLILLALPAVAHSQEATPGGTVTDSTGGVLPGTTVTATNVSTGNNFVAVTDQRGNYRMPIRVGNYRVVAELQVGGEFINNQYDIFLCNQCGGLYDARGGPVPSTIQQLFPVWNDISTWNLNGLNPIIRFYQIGLSDQQFNGPIRNYSAWAQDDWTVSKRLTLNLCVRYDFPAEA